MISSFLQDMYLNQSFCVQPVFCIYQHVLLVYYFLFTMFIKMFCEYWYVLWLYLYVLRVYQYVLWFYDLHILWVYGLILLVSDLTCYKEFSDKIVVRTNPHVQRWCESASTTCDQQEETKHQYIFVFNIINFLHQHLINKKYISLKKKKEAHNRKRFRSMLYFVEYNHIIQNTE